MSQPKGVSVKEAHTEGRGSLVYSPDGRCVHRPPSPLAREAAHARARR